ncbi:MAG: glutamine-hydrolyzing carbamoyl-phosphate synthase small subunit, partial [Micrococcales bacterium]|nr:glutamine-hydrolyzing carbamoyl-phosphate synthase small subunit [Micrococcales bacterium]
MSESTNRALLVLEDGEVFTGVACGALGQSLGELVFNTAMTGHQEILTDPACRGQIVVMTAPHVGNTGVNTDDDESRQIWAAGLVARSLSRLASNWRATGTLSDALVNGQIVGMSEVDTRAVTLHLREHGTMKAGIFSGSGLADPSGRMMATEDLIAIVRSGMDAGGVVGEPRVVEAVGELRANVIAVDLGMRATTAARLAMRGVRVEVVPRSTSLEEILRHEPDGVVLTSGPGDPACAQGEVELVRGLLGARMPLLGIGLGHQVLGRALGFSTSKLPFGHRGANQPVKDLATGKVRVTTHHHGYTLEVRVGEPVRAPWAEGRFGS